MQQKSRKPKNQSTLKEEKKKRKGDELINPITCDRKLLSEEQFILVIGFESSYGPFIKYERDGETLPKNT